MLSPDPGSPADGRGRPRQHAVMTELRAWIRQLGGVAATHELYRAGATRETLRLAVRAGEIRRIRHGWYIDPETPSAVADALRVGGRVTCATLLHLDGLWMRTAPDALHVTVPPNACRLRDPGDYRRRLSEASVVVHWSDARDHGSRLRASLPSALLEFAACVGVEDAFVAAECAVARGILDAQEWSARCRAAPAAVRFALAAVGGLSGSGTESIFVFRMRRLGIRVRQQVQIGRDRVDVVIGDRLVVELDSREFHERERDYERDARLGVRGYRVLRFSYRQVVFDWSAVENAVLAALARGDHR